jgi:branched-chain amino acid transport system ATP-binding protein
MVRIMDILEVQAITVTFGGLVALEDVSINVAQGEILGIAGPNGSGKTTLLNVINGYYRPQRGRVLFMGRDITGLPPSQVARMGITRVFQGIELFRHGTVMDNVLVGRHPFGRANVLTAMFWLGPALKDEARQRHRAEEVLDFLEISRFRDAPVSSLPYGIQKLVGLARALAGEPKLLLLDEPASGMNRQEKEDFSRFLLRIKYELGVPMVWIEHDVQMLTDLCDRLVVLNFGQKVAEGLPEEVLVRPEVATIFIGKETITPGDGSQSQS